VVKQVAQIKNQGKSQQAQKSTDEANPQQQANVSSQFVESVGSIPSQLYQRLGLAMPRWLFWLLTIVVGITLSGLLVSTLALWTPLWSDIDRTDEELGMGGPDAEKNAITRGDLEQYFSI